MTRVGTSHDRLRRQTIEDLDALIQATVHTRRDLRTYQTAAEQNRRYLAAGGAASDMTKQFDGATLRATFSDSVSNLEGVRTRARRSVWRLQVAEGMTISEIARAWGLSRQLVSRSLASGGTRRRGTAGLS
jgi:hypothetical protein